MRLKRRVLASAPLLAPLLLLLLGAAPTPTTTPTRTPAADVAAGPGDVLLLVVDGMINLGTADYLRQGIAAAADSGAAAVVLQLDTPGGMLEPTKVIVKEMLGTPVPIIVYVAPAGASATSAGVFITMAGNVA